MKHVPFSLDKAKENISKILNEPNDYEYLDNLPDVNNDRLSYTNGAYVDTTAFFIDIRNSSKLTQYYYRPVIARYYRAYINLVLMALRSHTSFKEDNIVGDCVSAIFVGNNVDKYGGDPSDVIEALRSAADVSSLLDILNVTFYHKYGKKVDIKTGIGIERGNTLVFKVGLKGYREHKYVFLGNNVNLASHLCDHANKEGNPSILINKEIYNNCSKYIANSHQKNGNNRYSNWLNPYYVNGVGKAYGGNIITVPYYNEYKRLKKKYGI